MKIMLALFLFSLSAWGQEQTSYPWFDGDQERRVWVDPNWVARIEYPKSRQQSPRVTFIRNTKDKSKRNLDPVFRNSKTTGSRMVLPGNILVRFKSDMNTEAVKNWAAGKNSEIVEKVKFEPNSYILTSPSGLSALELANRVREDEGVTGAEPIWWTESARK